MGNVDDISDFNLNGYLSDSIELIRIAQKKKYKDSFDEVRAVNNICEKLKDKLLPNKDTNQNIFITLFLTRVLDLSQGSILLLEVKNFSAAAVLIRSLYETVAKLFCLIKYEDFWKILALGQEKEKNKNLKKALDGKFPTIDPVADKEKLELRQKENNLMTEYKDTVIEFAKILNFSKSNGKTQDLLRQISRKEKLFKLAGLESYYNVIYSYFSDFTHTNIETLDSLVVLDGNNRPKNIDRLNDKNPFESSIDFVSMALLDSFKLVTEFQEKESLEEYEQLKVWVNKHQRRVEAKILLEGKTLYRFNNTHDSIN